MNDIAKQIESIIDKNVPLVSNLSNVVAILNKMDNINWCGFYLVQDDYLYLGPFQGEIACTKIPYGKGVCGTAFKEKKTVIVPNVHEFVGHIACSSISKSEIVVPIIVNDQVKAVIDIDSPVYNRFTNDDKELLEKISGILKIIF